MFNHDISLWDTSTVEGMEGQRGAEGRVCFTVPIVYSRHLLVEYIECNNNGGCV
jgi:hypothetical protein